MAVDIFLKLDGIKGESQDAKHKDGDRRPVVFLRGVTERHDGVWRRRRSGQGAVPGSSRSLTGSTSRHRSCSCTAPTARHIKEATLTNRKAGKDQQEYLVLKLTDLIVTSVQHGDSAGGELPMESVTPEFREDRDGIQGTEGGRHARSRRQVQLGSEAEQAEQVNGSPGSPLARRWGHVPQRQGRQIGDYHRRGSRRRSTRTRSK